MICEPIWSEPDKIIFLNVKYIFENSWNGEFVKWWIRERWIREMINSWNCTFFVNSSTNFEYICLLVLRIINRKLENSWNNMTWTGLLFAYFSDVVIDPIRTAEDSDSEIDTERIQAPSPRKSSLGPRLSVIPPSRCDHNS